MYTRLCAGFLTICILVPAFTSSIIAQPGNRPNIVLIMADDVGYEVPGYTGGRSYDTPHIDRLAAEGLRFTHCYSTPKCAPSRVKIMTGRYMFRTTDQWGYIPPDEKTFGHLLQDAGYAVALAGKWQMALLGEDPLHIRKMGFDQFCVFGWHEGPRYHDPYIWKNGRRLLDVSNRFGPDVYVEFLIDFITKHRDGPFLAYYPMALAHDISNDFQPPPPPGPAGKYLSYAELIDYMDKNVGRLVDALTRLGLREETVVIFTSDNGTPRQFITDIDNGEYIRQPVRSVMGNHIISGGKSTLANDGTHVPLIVNWPGVSPSGKVCSDLIDFSDFLPTLAELAGVLPPADREIDGRSFAPQIRGETGSPREWIYNQFEGVSWIRDHRWKLYDDGHLFDITADPLEQMAISEEADDGASADIRSRFNTIFKEFTADQRN